jgi:uncharacterized protein (TIGR02145 family)
MRPSGLLLPLLALFWLAAPLQAQDISIGDPDGIFDGVAACVAPSNEGGLLDCPPSSVPVIEEGECSDGPAQCGGQSTVTFDGHTYALVGIGTQCWFKENLRSDHYRNGDAIPGDLSEVQWSSTTSGAMAVYNNDAANLATYGRLYNWYATQDNRGLCPAGFHVPSDDEWYTLEHFLGGSSVAGTAMKTSPTDTPSWDGSNTSGFSGLPAGFRSYGGDCYDLGRLGYLWSTFPTGGVAIFRSLYAEETHVYRSSSYLPQNGFSVRCVRD